MTKKNISLRDVILIIIVIILVIHLSV